MWLAAAAAPAPAQTSNTVTRIDTNPAGAQFFVDGSTYSGATSAIWPVYSKHILSAPLIQTLGQTGVQAQFAGWAWTGGGSASGQTLTVTADPSITEYTANFAVAFALTIDCLDSAGTVMINGGPVACGQQSYLASGSVVSINAAPNTGYVFGGWIPGPNQSIHGATDVVTMNAPVRVSPIFQPAREIDLTTVPANLQMLVDSTQVQTPYTAQWGAGSIHSIYPVSPQQDQLGAWWVCPVSSCAVPTYTVPAGSTPLSLTTTFVPGVPMGFYTSPAGLSLTIDNRSNWTSYSFIWGVGETHTVSAPSQQTDSQGRLWAFSSWSNGGDATQTVTVPDGVPGGVKYVATYTPLGQLTLTSQVQGLSIMVDGQACGLPCKVVRTPGTQVALSAPLSVPMAPGSRQDFLAWSNGATGDQVVTLGSDPMTLSANYHLMNLLAANSNPAGDASWNMQPASPDGFYDAATTVNVSVTPQPGFKFRLWGGDISGTSPSAAVAMNAPRSIQAILDKVPYVAPSAVANAAGGGAGTVAPGSVISIFGINLAQGTAVGPSSPLVQTLAGLTVHIGDRLLPLFFVSPTQINAQLPADFTPGQQTITVSGTGQPDVQTSVSIASDAPGLFQQPVNGQSMAVAFHGDGSAITSDSPAQQGETITVYGTGFGPTTPARPEGLPVGSSPVVALTDPISVQVGGAQCAVQNAFAVSGAIGVDAVQCTLGTGMTDGTLSVTINGQQSNTVVLPMQQ